MKWMVAVDLASGSAEVVDQAVPLAARLSAKVHLRAVSRFAYDTLEVYRSTRSEALAQDWEKRRQEEAEQLAALLGNVPEAMQGTAEVLAGAPAAALIAEAEGFDGLALGTHGRTGAERLFLGSVAERVVRSCPVPVWVLHLEGTPLPAAGPLKVLAPVDAAEPDLGPLTRVAQWLGDAAELHVVHALPDLRVADGRAPQSVWTERNHPQRAWAENAIHEALAEAGVTAQLHMVLAQSSNPATKLAAFAESFGADLLVMATHGRRNIARLAYGSVAERLVRFAPCATVVMHASPT